MNSPEFRFLRGRGLVWVCDLEGSTKLLNDDVAVGAIEEFLPRLHWLARATVQATGGQFVKWNGDGFLAWFPFEFHRDIGAKSVALYGAIWQITALVNITQLCVSTDRALRLKHGVTMEHDALITRINGVRGDSMDLLGRAVVLAYRLAGIGAPFPGIVTQREVVLALREGGCSTAHFKSLRLSRDARLKFLKGESWGTTGLQISCGPNRRSANPAAAVRRLKRAIQQVEAPINLEDAHIKQNAEWVLAMARGPEWAKRTLVEYGKFLHEDLLGTSKAIAEALER